MSVEKIEKFLEESISRIAEEMASYENSAVKELYLKCCIRNYKILLAFIKSPEKEKAMVLQTINSAAKIASTKQPL